MVSCHNFLRVIRFLRWLGRRQMHGSFEGVERGDVFELCVRRGVRWLRETVGTEIWCRNRWGLGTFLKITCLAVS